MPSGADRRGGLDVPSGSIPALCQCQPEAADRGPPDGGAVGGGSAGHAVQEIACRGICVGGDLYVPIGSVPLLCERLDGAAVLRLPDSSAVGGGWAGHCNKDIDGGGRTKRGVDVPSEPVPALYQWQLGRATR